MLTESNRVIGLAPRLVIAAPRGSCSPPGTLCTPFSPHHQIPAPTLAPARDHGGAARESVGAAVHCPAGRRLWSWGKLSWGLRAGARSRSSWPPLPSAPPPVSFRAVHQKPGRVGRAIPVCTQLACVEGSVRARARALCPCLAPCQPHVRAQRRRTGRLTWRGCTPPTWTTWISAP